MTATKTLQLPLLVGVAGLALLLLVAATGWLVYHSLRKKASHLAAERERYYLFSRLSGTYLFEYDYASRRILVSGEVLPSLSLTTGEAQRFCHPDDCDRLEPILRAPPASGEKLTLECRLRHAEGAFIWYACKVMTVFDERGRPLRLVGQLEDISQWKAHEAALVASSTTDDLTGLLNKSALALQVDEFLRSPRAKQGGALLMLDLDNFKAVNDTGGHTLGDQALQLTAQLLRESFRRVDLLSRAGGDEFLVFLPGSADHDAVCQKAAALCTALEETAAHTLRRKAFTCSVGVAFTPEDGSRFSDLFDAADAAMYTAKHSGKNTCALCEKTQKNA